METALAKYSSLWAFIRDLIACSTAAGEDPDSFDKYMALLFQCVLCERRPTVAAALFVPTHPALWSAPPLPGRIRSYPYALCEHCVTRLSSAELGRAVEARFTEADLALLSPARSTHLNPYGKFYFDVERELQRKGFRPLR